MPSKQAEAVKRYWAAVRLASEQPDAEQPDTESWGDLTAEPREVDYIETVAGGLPAMWAVPKRSAEDRVLAHRVGCPAAWLLSGVVIRE
jgi:hypothetical protein